MTPTKPRHSRLFLRAALASLLAVAIHADAALGQPASDPREIIDSVTPEAGTDPSATPETLRERERAMRIDMHLQRLAPEPISDEVIASWADQLEFDQDRRELLDDLRREYAERTRQIRERLRPRLLARWAGAFTYDEESRRVIPVFTPALIELYETHESLLQRLHDADSFLINALGNQVGREARRYLQRFRAQRLRSLLIDIDDRVDARIDLARLVESIEPTQDEHAKLADALEQYQRSVIEHMEERPLWSIAMEKRYARTLIEYGPYWWLLIDSEEADAAYEELLTLRRLASAPRTAAELAELNWSTIDALAGRLDTRRSIELRSRFLHELTPHLFREQERVLDFVRSMRNRLPDEDNLSERIDERLDRAMREIMPVARRLVESWLATQDFSPPLPLPGQPRAAPDRPLIDALDEATAEVDRLDLERDRRDILIALLDWLEPLALPHLQRPQQRAIAWQREALEHVNEADAYRIDRLRGAIDDLRRRITAGVTPPP